MRLAPRATLIAFFRRSQCTCAIESDEAVQTGIECLDALKRALDELYG